MKARFTSVAETEFSDAADFYESSEAGIGEEFIDAVLSSIARIETYPNLGRPLKRTFRSFPTRTFPYNLVYEVLGDEIIIHAVAHHSRKPEYWIDLILDR